MKRHCHLGNILIDIFLFINNHTLNHLPYLLLFDEILNKLASIRSYLV